MGYREDRAYFCQVLNLPGDYTLEQLRYNYKVLARQLHPDKCGARFSREQANAAFHVLTDAYKWLLKEVRGADQPFDVLRREARAAEPPPSVLPALNDGAKGAKKSFNIARFNEVFETERMDVPVADAGYADWMSKNDPERELRKEEQAANRQLIKYTEPTPVTLTRKGCVQYTELGVERVEDYSREDATRHGIQYTDYRVAHTTTRLVDEAVAADRTNFKSIEDIKRHRAAVSYTMSEDDLRREDERRRREEEAERRRVEVQRQYDDRMASHFERVHRSMLGFAGTATI